jgi:hypothetical protein
VPPTTAAVKLDGIYRGHSPLRLEGVRAGNRVLDLEADGFAPVTRRIDLEGGDTMKMDVLLEARAAP